MKLTKIACDLYEKYKVPLALIVIIVIAYKVYKSFIIQEGLLGATSCTQFSNCAQCVNGEVYGNNGRCYWNSQKNHCGSFKDTGYSTTCSGPSYCDKIANCQLCTSTNCFWGDRDQQCSSTLKAGYGKICSGSNPNCPKCEACPKLTLLKTPTFITQQ
jgi:hypothetical protein